MPTPGSVSTGGFVKFQRLAEMFPNEWRSFNILYLGSSSAPPDAQTLARIARRRGAKLAWNQNGVAYPAWHGPGYEKTNAPMAALLGAADHVFYQSAFCKTNADRYLGAPKGSWEILHNAVDTQRFTPNPANRDKHFTLLLPGNQYVAYKVEVALATLASVARSGVDAQLLVTGWLRWPGVADATRATLELAQRLGVADRVVLTGGYAQRDAPALYRRAHVLLHPKVNDPCPNAVIEAMACGIPVVHSASGGVPELVGDEAGIGVESETSWEVDVPPSPELLAEAIITVAGRLDEYAEAARRRAVERFDLRPWVARHRDVFERLVQ